MTRVMMSESGSPRGGRPWTLLLGPGERLEAAFPLLQAILSDPTADNPQGGDSYLEQTEDLGALICDFPNSGRLLLDADVIPLEDVGLVRRFCAQHPSWELHLLGEDPGRAAARALRELRGARWMPAPLDVSSLHSLAERMPDVVAGVSPAAARPDREATLEAEAGLLTVEEVLVATEEGEGQPTASAASSLIARVEAILEGDAEPAAASQLGTAVTRGPEPRAAVLPKVEAAPSEAAPSEAIPPTASRAPAPAPYFKNQIADLADLVQRVDLNLESLRLEAEDSASPDVAHKLEEVSAEAARLKQFARTLSYLAAPPPPGNQRFELAPMIEELLTARRSEPGSPRYLVRTSDPLAVRSDKALLGQVFDALLYLSHHLAGENGTIRVDGRLEEDPAGLTDRVRVSIRFPAPDHPELEAADVLVPYGLRRLMPELGPNALAAAAGIVKGQGGSLELVPEQGGFEWVLRLPHAE